MPVGMLFFTACGKSSDASSTVTTIGSAASIVSSDINATMAPSPTTLKSINNSIATVLKTDVQTKNEKEATTFTKETQYCDISGLKESINTGTLVKITKTQTFNACKNSQYLQNGYLKIDYSQMNSEGKFPKIVQLTVQEDFTFNDLLLKKGTVIDSTIEYNVDNSIKSVSITSSGVVTYQYGTYSLTNNSDTVTY